MLLSQAYVKKSLLRQISISEIFCVYHPGYCSIISKCCGVPMWMFALTQFRYYQLHTYILKYNINYLVGMNIIKDSYCDNTLTNLYHQKVMVYDKINKIQMFLNFKVTSFIYAFPKSDVFTHHAKYPLLTKRQGMSYLLSDRENASICMLGKSVSVLRRSRPNTCLEIKTFLLQPYIKLLKYI